MLQIGRKVYFDKFTGDLLAEISERQGAVRETTLEEDFASYTGLQGRTIESVGVIQLEYGQDLEQFSTCYGYKIDTETNQIVFNFIPPQATFEEAKIAKIKEITTYCQNDINSPFESLCSGVSHTYGYNQQDAQNMMKQKMIFDINPTLTDIYWSSKEGVVALTKEQFINLLLDAAQHEQQVWGKYFVLKSQIDVATTVEQLEAVVWA